MAIPATVSRSELRQEKSMRVKLPSLLLAAVAVLVSGCMSSNADRQAPNYVEAELTDDPIPRGSMVAMPDLPGDIGEPE
jgi:hypothetical protein